MAGLLGDIYSTIDSTKRKLSDFVQNPVESTRQFIFNRNEDAGKQLGLLDQSFRGANGQLTIGPQTPQAQAAHNQLTDGLLSAMMGATVWHGSPHKFNKFDSSKIGTGEGAQAYGHGLYLAESPDVARAYQSTLSDFGLPDGKDVMGIAKLISAQGIKGEERVRKGYGALKAGTPELEQTIAQAKQAIDNSSSLYKVDLPDEHIAKMLDWDKPFKEQPKFVQNALKKSEFFAQAKAYQKQTGASYNDPAQKTGDGLLKYMRAGTTDEIGGPLSANGAAEEYLRSMGIPGIRYLDGGSRGTGAGTSNYVVFPGNEGFLKILERNGQGLLD